MKKVIILLLLSIVSFPQKKAFTFEDIYKVKSVGTPVISSDGNKIAFTSSESDLAKGTSNTEVYLMNADGSNSENISNYEKSDVSPFFSPDGKLLYFLSSRSGKMQLFSYSLSSKKIDQVTELNIDINNPLLSPDGKLLAFSADIYPECAIDFNCSDSLTKSTENGPIQAYIADKLLFRHWTDYNRGTETHVFVYDLNSKKVKDMGMSEWASDMFKLGGGGRFAFSPDSKELCIMHNPDKVWATSTNADIWTVNIATSEKNNITVSNKSWDGSPLYSPDGKYIAYTLQEIPAYEADRYRIALYDRTAKSSRILTENFDQTVDDIRWSSDSKTIYFSAQHEGYSPIYSLNISSGKITDITGKQSTFGFEINDAKGEIVYNARTIDKPAEIFKIRINDMKSTKQLTDFNGKLLSEVDFRPAEQLWIEGAEGKKVQVFLIKPHDFDPNKKYPLVLNVHGGPQSQWMDAYRSDWQIYPGYGYVLAFPNPHGSTGFGEKYTQSISKDYGGKVFEDLMKVTDALEKLPFVDKDRMGAMGWSFGGYMMNWFQAKTTRFKCLASMMGIYDLEAMWGGTEELWFVNWDLGGQPWNSEYYKKYSPSEYVKNFKTPALILTGEKDYRIPYTQGIQYFTTLQTLGIDSRLIIFPNDGHWPNPVKSMPLYYNAHLEWFNKYLGGGKAPYNSEDMIKNISFNKETK